MKIENPPQRAINVEEIENTTNADEMVNLDMFKNMLINNSNSVKEGIKLLNQLPRRNIIVNKRVKIRRINGSVKYYFMIITQVGNSRFEV